MIDTCRVKPNPISHPQPLIAHAPIKIDINTNIEMPSASQNHIDEIITG
jgi:hypothetical protein